MLSSSGIVYLSCIGLDEHALVWDISQAVDDPRIHEELVPEMDVEVENKTDYYFPDDIRNGLRALGHNVTVASDSVFAVVQAVCRKPGEIYAKSDPRKSGAPAGD